MSYYKALSKGVTISVIATILLVLVLAIFSYFGFVPNSLITTLLFIISVVSVLFSSIITSKKIENKGIISGLIFGLLYFIVIFIISSVIKKNIELTTRTFIMLIADICAGMLGGIIGVNLKN